jgi:hypothetical protein
MTALWISYFGLIIYHKRLWLYTVIVLCIKQLSSNESAANIGHFCAVETSYDHMCRPEQVRAEREGETEKTLGLLKDFYII